MNLSCLLSLLKDVPAYAQLAKELSTTKDERKAIILDAAKPYLIAALYEQLGLPIMVLTAQPETVRKLHEHGWSEKNKSGCASKKFRYCGDHVPLYQRNPSLNR